MKLKRFLLILLSYGFIGLYAQDSQTDIIPVGSRLTRLSSDQFTFTESPVWYADSVLLFTNEGMVTRKFVKG
jgi:hypothetical protein